ncbi:hypothetical protein AR158_c393L [Paramecium bursaria Chlorella virus AR158]|uniref:hypothetical protein n=1 Tax=Paramecium bursaria Chlorella virus AR158 TaxID=380598 RepID=UPI00015AA6B2|nr:hypothetical protein AR158_c393L [Paramecium bursaria Chlorella virus AR158]ABU43938.1 hypothetical protein AR158_c393L [Paramecium bursaria Chlorella virus AR158]
MTHHLYFYSDIHRSNVVASRFARVLLDPNRRTSRPSLCSCSISRRDFCRDLRLSSTLLSCWDHLDRRDHRMFYTKIRSVCFEPKL